MKKSVFCVDTTRDASFIYVSVTGLALVSTGVVVDGLEARTVGIDSSVYTVLAAVHEVVIQPPAVDPVLIADGHSREV